MNNVVNNPKTLSRMWAALSCDFEALIAKYMSSKGWRYIHFATICVEMQITLIMHITQGRGKTKDEHYYRITDMIIQLAKDLWLRSSDRNFLQQKSTDDNGMELKRSLGGFYLMYTMYEKQPIRDKVKINVGIEDMIALHTFCNKINDLPFQGEVAFMLQYLEFKHAFHYCVFSVDYRFEASTRNFLNVSQSDAVRLTKRMRDAQDTLAFSSVHDRSEMALRNLIAVKQSIARTIVQTSNLKDLSLHMQEKTLFTLFKHTVSSDGIKNAMCKLDKILDKPVMTVQGLTATDAIDRRIMMETRRRMERARKKVLQTTDRDIDHKAIRPYVREGGIFGRKKETEEGEDKTKRRERGSCNGNLWIYINGQDFDKPMSDPLGKFSRPQHKRKSNQPGSPNVCHEDELEHSATDDDDELDIDDELLDFKLEDLKQEGVEEMMDMDFVDDSFYLEDI